MNRVCADQRVSVQADIGCACVKPRSGGRSQNERADVLANQGVLRAGQT